jgi:hypothetical protein
MTSQKGTGIGGTAGMANITAAMTGITSPAVTLRTVAAPKTTISEDEPVRL